MRGGRRAQDLERELLRDYYLASAGQFGARSVAALGRGNQLAFQPVDRAGAEARRPARSWPRGLGKTARLTGEHFNNVVEAIGPRPQLRRPICSGSAGLSHAAQVRRNFLQLANC